MVLGVRGGVAVAGLCSEGGAVAWLSGGRDKFGIGF